MDRFFFITDRKKFKRPFLDQVKHVLDKGIRLIQVREKDLPEDELFSLLEDVVKVSQGYGAKIFVNSRVDMAVLLNLEGVHLPSRSIPLYRVKHKFPHLKVGKSCHTVEELLKAQEDGADYLFFSPIFPVEGKGRPVGIEGLTEILKVVKVPVYALGGINKINLKEVLDTGVYGVAGIRMFIED